jgi:phosphopantetheinyl transferase
MRLAWCRLNGKKGHDAGRQLLQQLYHEETGKALPRIHIAERGKPYFADGSFCFSISHTRNYAFCVLSEKNIAIDAEELDRPVNLRLAEKILSPGEKAQFDAAADPRRALLTFWVLKEAAVKLTGEGLRGYPCRTDFSLEDGRVQQIDGCLVAIMEE